MKIFIVIILFPSYCFGQLDNIEDIVYCGEQTAVNKIDRFDEEYIRKVDCFGANSVGTWLEKVNLEGNVEWSIGPDVITSWAIDDYTLTGDTCIWTFEYENGCDVIGEGFAICRYGTDGQQQYSYSGLGAYGTELELSWLYNQVCPVNDSLVMVDMSGGTHMFNFITEEFINSPGWQIPDNENRGIVYWKENHVIAFSWTEVKAMDQTGEVVVALEFDELVVDVVSLGEEFLVLLETEVVRVDGGGNILDIGNLGEFDALNFDVYADLIVVAGLGNNGEQIIELDQNLNIIDSWSAEDDFLTVQDAVISHGETELSLGGLNGHHNSYIGVQKSYLLDGNTVDYHQDIGVTSVEFVNIEANLEYVWQGDSVYWTFANQALVEVTNFGDEVVEVFNLYNSMQGSIVFCGPLIESLAYIETIQPGESVTVVSTYIPGGYITNLEWGEELMFDGCFWTHGPDGRMDDVPENDYLCHEQSWIFTSVAEIESEEVSGFYKPMSNTFFLSTTNQLTWQLFDLQGKLIEHGIKPEGEQLVNFDSSQSGMYILVARNDKQSFVSRFIR